MAGNILLSVSSVIFHKKDCFKCVIIRKNSKSEVGGNFDVCENLAISWKRYFLQKDCFEMCDHPEKLSQVGGVLVAGNILLSVGSIISHKKDCLKMCDH